MQTNKAADDLLSKSNICTSQECVKFRETPPRNKRRLTNLYRNALKVIYK